MSDLSAGFSLSAYVADYYDRQPEHEWVRAERHRTEFAVTLRALEKYLPPPPAHVLDCGGGPGRYAIELTRRGYRVTLFDLSSGNLKLAQSKAQESGVQLQAYEHGDATDLSRFAADSFDAVLLMGPLYHLLELPERQQALTEARRVLKPGGPLLAAFISRFAAHRYAARWETEWIVQKAALSQALLKDGRMPPRPEPDSFAGYFAHPSEVAPLCWEAGLEVEALLGVEGLVSMIEDQVNTLDGELWQAWVNLNEQVAGDASIHGGVEHLLVVARKPLWRAVLRRIVRKLDEDGLPYNVAGGTSAALQGVRLHVRDIDIEMDAQGAYRFQELFSDEVVEPVRLCNSENGLYRSHFGRFDFAGLRVEAMGDNHRREVERWTPTRALTRRQVDLDGILVTVSWLEEETLAYIRRGRIERAAQCLLCCDRERMLALLRGEQPIGVV